MRCLAGLCLGLAGFLAPAAVAQRSVELSVRGGFSLAQVRGGTLAGVQAGATGGVFARVPLGKGFAVQPGLVYVRKGGGGQEDEIEDAITFNGADVRIDEASIDAGIRIDYLEVPLLLAYTVPLDRPFAPRLLAGPYVALGFNQQADVALKGRFAVEGLPPLVLDEFTDINEFAFLGIEPIDAAEVTDHVDYGLALGAELDVLLGGRQATLSLRYDLGLRDVTNTESETVEAVQQLLKSIDDFEGSGFEGKTSTFSVLLGLTF